MRPTPTLLKKATQVPGVLPFAVSAEDALNGLKKHFATTFNAEWSWFELVCQRRAYVPYYLMKSQVTGRFEVSAVKKLQNDEDSNNLVRAEEVLFSNDVPYDKEWGWGNSLMQVCAVPQTLLPPVLTDVLRHQDDTVEALIGVGENKVVADVMRTDLVMGSDEVYPLTPLSYLHRGGVRDQIFQAAQESVHQEMRVTGFKEKDMISTRADTSVNVRTLSMHIRPKHVIVAYLPAHMITVLYDGALHTFVVCGHSGDIGADWVVNPITTARTAGAVAACAILANAALTGEVNVALAALPAGVLGYYGCYYGSRWLSRRRGKPEADVDSDPTLSLLQRDANELVVQRAVDLLNLDRETLFEGSTTIATQFRRSAVPSLLMGDKEDLARRVKAYRMLRSGQLPPL
eukprot:PhM_4_TR14856/c0_g1_i1/m.26134